MTALDVRELADKLERLEELFQSTRIAMYRSVALSALGALATAVILSVTLTVYVQGVVSRVQRHDEMLVETKTHEARLQRMEEYRQHLDRQLQAIIDTQQQLLRLVGGGRSRPHQAD